MADELSEERQIIDSLLSASDPALKVLASNLQQLLPSSELEKAPKIYCSLQHFFPLGNEGLLIFGEMKGEL
jgi:hypothetical protein